VHFRNLGKLADESEASPTALLALEWTAEDPEDNWLISYADLLSVIFAMVVLLFGRMLASAPQSSEMEELAAAAAPPAVQQQIGAAAPVEPRASGENTGPSAEDRLADLVEQRFSGRIETRRRERGLTLTIPAVALFDSARADLELAAIPLLSDLGATLREAGDTRISVEGHTDDVPLQGTVFDSNWSLAAARANSVTRFLIEQGFAPARLQSVSFADTRPVADNATVDGRAANRRVELQIEVAADPG
jgi:chemotaxis protein MotB